MTHRIAHDFWQYSRQPVSFEDLRRELLVPVRDTVLQWYSVTVLQWWRVAGDDACVSVDVDDEDV